MPRNHLVKQGDSEGDITAQNYCHYSWGIFTRSQWNASEAPVAPVITWCTCMRKNILTHPFGARVRHHLRWGMCRCRQTNRNSMLISGLEIIFSPLDGSIFFSSSFLPFSYLTQTLTPHLNPDLHKGPIKTSIGCLLSVWWRLPTWSVICGSL